MFLAIQIGLILHPIGIACSVLVLLSILGISAINRSLANRMTVRLIAAIALADLLSHSAEFYAAKSNSLTLGSPICSAVNGFRVFGRTFYSFTNIAICFHLYRSLVLLKKPTWKNEAYTWTVTLVMVSIFTLIYWSLGAFSGVKRKFGCNPGADDITYDKIHYILAGSVDFLTIAVCIFTTVVGHRSLNKWIDTYVNTRSYQGQDLTQFKNDRMRMAKRSFLYPLSTCVTLPIEAIFLIFKAFDIFLMWITIPMVITIGISGLLTSIAFAIDPASHKAFAAAYIQIKEKLSGSKKFRDNNEDKYAIPLAQKL